MVFGMAIDSVGPTPQVGHCREVVHAFRHFNSDTEQLEHALIPVGVAEPVGHHILITGVNALESIEIPIPAEHALSAFEDFLSILCKLGVNDDSIVLHGYIPL